MSIIQWNIRGVRSNFEELVLLCNRHRLDIVALQECRAKDFTPPRGYFLLQDISPSGDTCHLIHNSFRFTVVALQTNLSAVAATITIANKQITVCSIYLSPSINVRSRDIENLLQQLPTPFLILGDFNAHSPFWGDSRQDSRGRMIEHFLFEA